MYKESVCAETETKNVDAMGRKQVGHKIHTYMLWENKMREHGEKAAMHIPAQLTLGSRHNSHTQVACTPLVFKRMDVVSRKLQLGKFNDSIFQLRTRELLMKMKATSMILHQLKLCEGSVKYENQKSSHKS